QQYLFGFAKRTLLYIIVIHNDFIRPCIFERDHASDSLLDSSCSSDSGCGVCFLASSASFASTICIGVWTSCSIGMPNSLASFIAVSGDSCFSMVLHLPTQYTYCYTPKCTSLANLNTLKSLVLMVKYVL